MRSLLSRPKLGIIVARGQNNVIGIKNSLPWHLSSDLKLFKERTLGKPVLMGRKTWESLKRALPERPNLILTQDRKYKAENATICFTFEDMVKMSFMMAEKAGISECIVMGGASLYKLALNIADKLYITEVKACPEGDTFFPCFDESLWQETERLAFQKSETNNYSFIVRTLIRK